MLRKRAVTSTALRHHDEPGRPATSNGRLKQRWIFVIRVKAELCTLMLGGSKGLK